MLNVNVQAATVPEPPVDVMLTTSEVVEYDVTVPNMKLLGVVVDATSTVWPAEIDRPDWVVNVLEPVPIVNDVVDVAVNPHVD